jgi:hypothetical protein
MKRLKGFLKNLEIPLKKLNLNKNKTVSVNLYFQDESRFGLIIKQKRVITVKGVKPIGKNINTVICTNDYGEASRR